MSDQSDAVDLRRVIGEDDPGATTVEQEKSAAAQEINNQAGTDQLSMQIRIYSPYREYFDGLAFSLSAENTTGPFDILPKHHNFISLLDACELTVRTIKNDEQRIRISGGIMHVKADQLIVFLDV